METWVWELNIYCANSWVFSTKEMAEMAIKYFELNEGEYSLSEVKSNDDATLLELINQLDEKTKKKRGLI